MSKAENREGSLAEESGEGKEGKGDGKKETMEFDETRTAAGKKGF